MSQRAKKFHRESPDIRRETLVEAALRCLARDGHAGLSVRRIAAEAQLSVGMINHLFTSIDRLVAQAYETVASGITDGLIATAEEAGGSPRERLARLIEASFAPRIMDTGLMNVWVVFWSLIPHSADMQAVQKRTSLQYRAAFEAPLRAIALEEKRDLDAARIALGITTMLDGLWLEFCLNPSSYRIEEGIALCRSWLDGVLSLTPPGSASGA